MTDQPLDAFAIRETQDFLRVWQDQDSRGPDAVKTFAALLAEVERLRAQTRRVRMIGEAAEGHWRQYGTGLLLSSLDVLHALDVEDRPALPPPNPLMAATVDGNPAVPLS